MENTETTTSNHSQALRRGDEGEFVGNESFYIFKYSNWKRFFIGLAYLFMPISGFFLILIGNWFTVIFGIILVVIGIIRALDIYIFKALIFNDDYLIKQWYFFGQKKILLLNLKVTAAKRVWSGLILFEEKDDSIIDRQLMFFETFPIGNSGFKKIKKILIEKKVIQGDEHEWNY